MEYAIQKGKVIILSARELKERFEKEEKKKTSEGWKEKKTENFQRYWGELYRRITEPHIHFCKVELYAESVFGELILTKGPFSERKQYYVEFYLDREQFILVKEKEEDFLDSQIVELIREEECEPVRFFLRFLSDILKDDMKYMQELEAMLYHVEEEISQRKSNKAPSEEMNLYRKKLIAKSFRYQQLVDMSDTLSENANDFFSEKEVLSITNFGNKAERLVQHSRMLREYIVQIKEMYQQQLDAQQNNIMRILTVVTTIFFPLTLIAGWYGMNFVNMPELNNPHGYLIIIAICVVIVLGEVVYFKKKKLL